MQTTDVRRDRHYY